LSLELRQEIRDNVEKRAWFSMSRIATVSSDNFHATAVQVRLLFLLLLLHHDTIVTGRILPSEFCLALREGKIFLSKRVHRACYIRDFARTARDNE